jgi:hypothetical protein
LTTKARAGQGRHEAVRQKERADDELGPEDQGHHVSRPCRVDGQRIGGAVLLTDETCFRLGSEIVRFERVIDERPTKTDVP